MEKAMIAEWDVVWQDGEQVNTVERTLDEAHEGGRGEETCDVLDGEPAYADGLYDDEVWVLGEVVRRWVAYLECRNGVDGQRYRRQNAKENEDRDYEFTS